MRAILFLLGLSAALQSDRKDRPVARVIGLLQGMHRDLQAEQKKDEEIFAKMECWCKVNKKDKEAAVGIATQAVSDLTNAIQEHSAKSAQRAAEMKQLKKDIADNKEALAQSTSIREKEAEAFYSENKDLLQSIEMLKNAIIVLKKHHEPKAFQQVQSVVRHLLWKHGDRFSPKHQSMLQLPVFQSYDSQSGEIFGILGDMKDTMERDLGDAKSTEDGAIAAFQDYKSAKESETAAAQDSFDTKASEHAAAVDGLARAKEDLEATRGAQAADVAFLSELNLKCQNSDNEWSLRQKVRNQEMAAVTEAITILSEDDAKDTFNKSVNSDNSLFKQISLVQVGSETRSKAAELIRAVARKSGNTMLAALASRVQLDAFVKVKKAIDGMVSQLKTEQKDEVAHRDWCNSEFRQNDKTTTQENREKEDLETKIADLSATIDQLTEEVANHKNEIAENEVEKMKASQLREAENAEFQTTLKDQRAAQAVLQKALDRLNVFYAEKATAALLQQTPGAAAPAAPHSFDTYANNQASNSVLTMISSIIEESKTTEADAVKGEAEAQADYEALMKNTNDSNAALQGQIVNKSEGVANSEEEKASAEQDHTTNKNDLQALADYAANLHQSCDFIVKNFTIRQQARADEIEAMLKAKDVLSGSM